MRREWFERGKMLSSFSEFQDRINISKEALEKSGYTVLKFEILPPVSIDEIEERQKNWPLKIPDEIKKFMSEVSSHIKFEWTDYKYWHSHNKNVLACKLPEPEYGYWPWMGYYNLTFEQMEWEVVTYWPHEFEDVDFLEENTDYFPFDVDETGSSFIYQENPLNEKSVLLYGDNILCYYTPIMIADSFYDFWDCVTLLGCPHRDFFNVFYDEKTQILDPYCENALKWREFLGIENLK